MREAPVRLRCEYQSDPMGIDTPRPRLSWWLNDPRAAEVQTGYQIQVASTIGRLEFEAADLWDSGYVSSGQTVNVEYRGSALSSGSRAWWRVRCYDSDGGPSPWSRAASFEVGLLSPDDWQAQWIASPLTGSPVTGVPAPVLYRDFELVAPVTAARLYLAVLGSARLEINGRPVDGAVPLEPWRGTRGAPERIPYRVHDVTDHLVTGWNRVGAVLGDGDYCGHAGGGARQRQGMRPALCAQLAIDVTHGDAPDRVTVVSDVDWRWRASWLLRADRDRGEEVDGRRPPADWSTPDPGAAGYPVVVERHDVERVADRGPAARADTAYPPATEPLRRREGSATRLRYDFGRSLLGRLRLTLRAPLGAVVTVTYGDADPDGIGGADDPALVWGDDVDVYTAGGEDRETFEPDFALHRFRWVELVVSGEPCDVLSVEAVEVAAALEPAGSFQCDHRLLSELFAAADRTYALGLALGPVRALAPAGRVPAPADVPAIVAGATACRDAAAALQGWMTSLATAAGDDGAAGDGEEMAAWLPSLWQLYRCYGDHRLLEQLFPAVQRHLTRAHRLWPERHRGDQDDRPLRERMLATAWYCYALSIATRMAGVLGRLAELKVYEEMAARIAQAFRRRFLTRDGLLVEDDQLGYLLALELGLVEGPQRLVALERLESQLRRDGYHVKVDARHGGLLLEVLSLEGRVDLAYQLLLQTTAPGWLHGLRQGSGLLHDEARGLAGRLAAGCVAGWLQRFVLGLDLDDDLTPEQNAYHRVRFQPRPPFGPAFAAGSPVREASGHLDTVHGRYECGWRIGDDAFDVHIRVPGNCSARVILPDGSERVVVAGTHEIGIPLASPLRSGQGDIPVLDRISSGNA